MSNQMPTFHFPLAMIRRIPDREKKPGVQSPFLYTDERIVAMGGSLKRLNRLRKIMEEFRALNASPNKKHSRA